MNPSQLLRGLSDKRKTGTTDSRTRRVVNLPWDWVREDGVYGREGQPPWVYNVIPTVPLAWSDRDERLQVGGQLHHMLVTLGQTSREPMANMPSLSDNRKIHLVSITLDAPPEASSWCSPELAELLREVYESMGNVPLRLCMIGVQCMQPRISDDDFGSSSTKNSMVEMGKILLGVSSSDMDLYANDIDLIKSIVYKYGARPPRKTEMQILESWYNRGHGNGAQIKAYPTYLDVVDSQDKIEFATVRRFNSSIQYGTQYTWASAAASHPAGAVIISVRGELEPAGVVVKRMISTERRQRSTLRDSSESGDLIDETQIDKFQLQRDVEGVIRKAGEALLVKTSIVMARYSNKVTENYTDMLNNRFQISVRPHWQRQISALEECMPCSDVQLSRFEQPMNIATLAYAGMGAFGEVGDSGRGYLVGMVDPDLSLCTLDPERASRGTGADQSPGVAILGDSGSGKRLSLDTELPTPTGRTTMGEVRVGDQLLDRFGRPCTVVNVSDTCETPDLYEVVLSDGQVIRADAEHQWIVSSRKDRHGNSKPKHKAAIANWQRRQAEVQAVLDVAQVYSDDELLTGAEVLQALHQRGLVQQWRDPHYLQKAMDFVGCPHTTIGEVYGTRLADRTDAPGNAPAVRLYPASTTFKSVALRLAQQAGTEPTSGQVERVLTTAEMIAEGIREPNRRNAANFSIQATQPLELPEAALPVAPWLLGAWLGDGNNRSHRLYTHVDDAEETARLVEKHWGHPADISLCKRGRAGGKVRIVGWPAPEGVTPFRQHLQELGIFANKRIPDLYLRGSFDQRLALLQGLMDADGSIGENGNCELSLSRKELVQDALELIRSLGIVAQIRESVAKIYEDDPDNVGERRARPTGLRYRICFTTNLPVFQLARKAALVPSGARRPTQSRLYIQDIRPVAPVPARCVQVDSPDSSYLCAGFVPTHNTFLMQWLAYQGALQGRTVIYINPKPKDDLSGLAGLVAERRRSEVIQLGDVQEKPGAFDPFRYSPMYAHVIATQFITDVLGPEWNQGQQIRLADGLKRAAAAGVRCVGDALQHFVEDREVVGQTLGLADNDPNFALGIAREARPDMVANRGLTLIQFDQSWPDVEPRDNLPIPDRVLLAIMRLIPRAALEILLASGGGGDLYIDEAHRLLGSQAGRQFVERQGKEGRSQRIMTVLGTHKPSEIINSGLSSYMGRIIALKQSNDMEAAKALGLVGLAPKPERIAAMARFGPQNPDDGGPLKPAQCFVRDLDGRHAGVIIHPIPERIRRAFSTSSGNSLRLLRPEAALMESNTHTY